MPINNHDDEWLEGYLKQFHPIGPQPLLLKKNGLAARLPFVAGAGAVAAGFIAAALFASHHRTSPQSLTASQESSVEVEQLVNASPLTLGSANKLLVTSPSFKAAVDQVAFQLRATPLSTGSHSVLAVLGKEKTKL